VDGRRRLPACVEQGQLAAALDVLPEEEVLDDDEDEDELDEEDEDDSDDELPDDEPLDDAPLPDEARLSVR
jgi:hypothetical protein